jgi:hypothetical protein
MKRVMKEDAMTRKKLFAIILAMVLFMFLLLGCGQSGEPEVAAPISATDSIILTPLPSTPTDVPPTETSIPPADTLIPCTPDSSIVWSDDFDDGDFDGWGTDYEHLISVSNGTLSFGPDSGGEIYHQNDISFGTWSFDVFLPDDFGGNYNIALNSNKLFNIGFGIKISSIPKTNVKLYTDDYGDYVVEGTWFANENLTGWNRIEVTRDDQFNTNVFLNGELILESRIEKDFTPAWFYVSGPPVGPLLDNVVVHNKVIEIQPLE